ncbi:hypothetical protein BCY89_03605 [Sphingobacterium siyangense]|uniref:Uncharacterized protein n=1 Tax=Sphingobacterium siyangense TaxID=459529 RepID=A0A420GBK9_9SPHI|nr:chitin binding peritrophin-A domain-containing protein [Sphingobacterium siyangense]RKF42568.1 hypothetical protein BCY89_03605 [Sphingobacterium siyangense]
MKRKTSIIYVLKVFFLLTLAISCQKEILLPEKFSSENQLITKAKSFVEQQKQNPSTKIDFTKLDFDWKRISVTQNKRGNDVLFVPIANRMKIGKEYWELAYLIDRRNREISSFKQFLGSLNDPTLKLNVLTLDGSTIESGVYDNDAGTLKTNTTLIQIKKRAGTKSNIAERVLVTTQRLSCPTNLYFNPSLNICDQRQNILDDWASQYFMMYIYDDGSYELGPDSRELEEVEVNPPTGPSNPGGGQTPPGNGGGGVPVGPGGGNSGGNPGSNPPPIIPLSIRKTPCEAVNLANKINRIARVKRIADSIQNRTDEHGAYIRFSNQDSTNSITFGNIYSNGTHSKIKIDPQFSANNGYDIGFIHNHPEKSGPSPTDVIVALHNLTQMDNNATISKQQMANYIDNFASIVVSGGYIYTITIKNARYISYAKDGFNKEKMNTLYNKYYKEYARSRNLDDTDIDQYQAPGEYALLRLFGEDINLSKQKIGVDNSNMILTRAGNSIAKSNPCN